MTEPRLAYLLKKFPRTSETFILNELLGLESHGLEPTILSRRQPDDEPRHPELAQLKAPIEYLPSARSVDPWTVLFGPGDQDLKAELFRRLQNILTDFGSLGHPRFPSLLAEAVHLLGRCRELDIGHIHSHFATDAAAVACLVHALGGPTYSITLHAKDIYRDTVVPAVLDHMVAHSAFSVTVCDANVRHIEGLVGAEARSKLRRLYNGIDLRAHAGTGEPRDEGHVLSVGRLVEKKGFFVLLEALESMLKSGRTVRASLVGEGDERDRIEEEIARRGLGDHVTLLGALDQGDVRKLMARATIMSLPCLIGDDGNRDALPTVLLEAQACGLPIVSTPVTGIPEIVDQGAAGLLVPERDPVALAESMSRLLDDDALRASLSKAGRERAGELFDLRKNSRTLMEWHTAALTSS
jgi:colanic acid/amylovoran biosynthesis glycosyltransferase